MENFYQTNVCFLVGFSVLIAASCMLKFAVLMFGLNCVITDLMASISVCGRGRGVRTRGGRCRGMTVAPIE